MIQNVQSELAAGNYLAALQDTLGNKGASVTISGGSVTFQGASSGSTGNISHVAVARVADVVSLSPAAQKLLSDSGIALALLNAASKYTNHRNSISTPDLSSQAERLPSSNIVQPTPVSHPIISPGSSPVVAADGSQLTASQIVDIAKTQESNPNYVYNVINSNVDFFTQGLSADVKASFVKALQNKTLGIESTSSIPGLNYQETTVITGTSESTIGGQLYNSNILNSRGGNGFITGSDFGGEFYVSWGASSTEQQNGKTSSD